MAGKLFTLRPCTRTKASARLRRARWAAGLTQEQAGQLLGVDARQIRRWENAEVPMGPLELVVLLEQAEGKRAA